MRVAYQGRPGAYSEGAARDAMGAAAELLPCATFEDVFAALAEGRASDAVVPVQNSLAGSVTRAYDLLAAHDVAVTGEVVARIDHVLAGIRGAEVGTLRRVLSHPVALAQCERFFARHPHLERVPVFDTAGAVEMVIRDGRSDTAAIASRGAAARHHAAVLLDDVQDAADNFTRFVAIRLVANYQSATLPHGPCKTMAVFAVRNEPGALLTALGPFAWHGVNLSHLESRPIHGRPFESSFIIEAEHDGGSTGIGAALDRLAAHAVWVKTLGTFPRAAAPAPLRSPVGDIDARDAATYDEAFS
ncbi:MAG TPA: prephenate dehydratase domain-containing protein [Vicinamibacterales bacterium]|nr:prephenate dehydratase domain-containing protein [Vicinamibacterales bacterium]